jgi:hypothetical protein
MRDNRVTQTLIGSTSARHDEDYSTQ